MTQSRSPLLPLFLVIFIDTFGYFLVLPVILRLFIHIDTSILPIHTSMASREWLYSITLMLSPLAFMSLAPFSGHLSDSFGRKKVIGACLIASLVGFLLPIIGIITRHISLILIGRFIAGAGTTSQPVAQAAITDFSTGKVRAFNLSLIGLSMTLAMILGPLGGAYLSNPALISWFNATTPYWAGTILAILNILLLIYFFDDRYFTIITKPNHQTKHLLRLFTIPIIGFLICFMMMQTAWSAFYQGSFLFLGAKYHFTTDTISEYAAYSGFWMCLGLTIIYRYWLKYMTVAQIAIISITVVIIGFIGLALFKSTFSLWLFVTPIALCAGTTYPSLLQLLTEHTPTDHQGWMLGVASTLLGLAWMLTGLFTASVLRHSLQLLFVLCAAILIAALTISFKFFQSHAK